MGGERGGWKGWGETLRLLHAVKKRVDLAFVQGGSGDAAEELEKKVGRVVLASLGSLFYEPVWVFYRAGKAKSLNRDATLKELSQLRGWRVDVGARGSGSPGLASKLLTANLMERDDIQRSNLDETPAVPAPLGRALHTQGMCRA